MLRRRACSKFVPVQGISHEEADEWEGTNVISKHGVRVSLGDAFLAVQQSTGPIVALEHNCGPVFVAVKHKKPGTRWLLVPDSP